MFKGAADNKRQMAKQDDDIRRGKPIKKVEELKSYRVTLLDSKIVAGPGGLSIYHSQPYHQQLYERRVFHNNNMASPSAVSNPSI